MTSPAKPGKRRAKLLDQVIKYILEHGLMRLSLRPLAAGIKTSPRMLLYFFGSKEQLITEVMAEIRLRQRVDFARALSGTGSQKERYLRAWNTWTAPRMEKFGRFWFGVYGLALRNPERFSEFLKQSVGDWLPLFEQAFGAAGFPAERASTLATLSLATMRGLLLDLLARGERARVNATLEELLRLLTLASHDGASRDTGRTKKRNNQSNAPRGTLGGSGSPECIGRPG
jgi:AcrR family transcriptional regulator